MSLLCYYYVIIMLLLCYYYAIIMLLLCYYYVIIMSSLCYYYVIIMLLLCHYYVLYNYALSHDTHTQLLMLTYPPTWSTPDDFSRNELTHIHTGWLLKKWAYSHPHRMASQEMSLLTSTQDDFSTNELTHSPTWSTRRGTWSFIGCMYVCMYGWLL